MGLFKKKKTKEQLERERREKEYQARMLISKTKKDLQKTIDRLAKQKTEFINIAKKAKSINDENGYLSAYSGWKISHASQFKASKMLIKLNITEQMREIGQISKDFSESMIVISRQLAEITKNTDYIATEQNFAEAMNQIMMSENQLEQFLNNMDVTIENYADSQVENIAEMDKEFLDLISQEVVASTTSNEGEFVQNASKTQPNSEVDDYISKKIEEAKKKIEEA